MKIALAISITLTSAGCALLPLHTGVIPVPWHTLLIDWQAGCEHYYVLTKYRPPRSLLTLSVGAALAVASVLIQGIVCNPLASPDVLGVNHAASLASVGALPLMSSLSVMVLPLLTFTDGVVGLILPKMLARTHQSMKLALADAALSACWADLTDYLMLPCPQDVNNALLWLADSLWGRDWSFVKIVVSLIVLFLPLSLSSYRDLDLLAPGDARATTLGMSVSYTRFQVLLLAVAMTSTGMAACGLISLTGLVVPHIMHSVTGGRHRRLLPVPALTGALLLVVIDLLARIAHPPLELPAGVLIVIVGAPWFVQLLVGMRQITLRTENPTVSYGTDKVLNDVSLSLPTGKITALIGPNSCGKSTLLNCFSRLLMSQSGTVSFGDNPVNMLSSRQLVRRLLLLPQHHLTPEGITIQELVSYGRNPWLLLWGCLSAEDNARVSVAVNRTRINHLAVHRLIEPFDGQRQRAFLVMILAQNTSAVLFDEPTTYPGINHQVDLMRLMGELRTQGKTVVAVLHDPNQVSRYYDQLVVTANGHVMAQGTPEKVVIPELLGMVFGVGAEIHPEPVSDRPMCLMRWIVQAVGIEPRLSKTGLAPANLFRLGLNFSGL